MQRKVLNKMIKWKDEGQNEPLLLVGPKCVGKTYLANEFGKTLYKRTVYMNFENNDSMKELFMSGDKPETNVDTIIERISTAFQIEKEEFIDNYPILFILDEITFLPFYPELLKMFQKRGRNLPIILISSSPNEIMTFQSDVAFHAIFVYSLDFEEFLIAIGMGWYTDVIREHFISNKKLPTIVHNELLSIFELYLKVGGMPLAVNEYLNSKNTNNIQEIHTMIEDFCINNLRLSNDDSLLLKIKHVIQSLHKQLEKDNKKFQYRLIRKGVTKKLYQGAIDRIASSKLAIKCDKLLNFKENKIETDSDSFKLYHMDVGSLYQGYSFDESFRKGVFENYIAQSLVSNGYIPYFWESNSQAKIDFVIERNTQLLPIEVKVDSNTRSKSLSIFHSFFKTDYSIKVSTRNFMYSNKVKYIPVYAVFCI